ncbi:GNAT family N-acetyltransferase [Aquihabitans sp. G128]|uniref:GNAT family N-acetyltransferase n=1 Tax=Aquihabitans sp. G128 TaxID=2849779 RepID=UPI001C22E354|nr:GNAT family N-acetyltransferase [Aquihabitans sp. G128]QXC61165.1 GNAT family N-acetyltransferase [Aquihabitans sp. G128]
MAPFPIRPRTEADLDGVADLLLASHHSHAYPVALPPDLRAWGAGDDVVAGWVATDPEAGDEVVGHAVLTDAHDDAATDQWVAATGLARDELVVVRRLLVHARIQGTGTGRALLATAVDAAHALGRRPVLDMADNLAEAEVLYRKTGFELVGAYDLDLTEHLPPGSDLADGDAVGPEVGRTRTHHLHVLTWIGPQVPDRHP